MRERGVDTRVRWLRAYICDAAASGSAPRILDAVMRYSNSVAKARIICMWAAGARHAFGGRTHWSRGLLDPFSARKNERGN